MKGGKWDARIGRASELAAAHPFAAEGLRFYERIAGFQKALYASVETAHAAATADTAHTSDTSGIAAGDGPAPAAPPSLPAIPASPPHAALRQDLELVILLPWFPPFLAVVLDAAPPPLAQSVAELRGQGVTRWQEVLEEFWREDADSSRLAPAESLIAWSFLQPYAEALADHSAPPAPGEAPALCPRCAGKPQVGVLRPQGDGAKRSLVCARCATEWDYRRLVCPACGEESVEKLPIYVAEEFRHVRVEACDTCRHYIKTVDLTKDGRAVPVVDELATIPLSLWAEENRYAKLRTNLLGI